LHPIEIAVNVELEQEAGMVRRAPCGFGHDTIKAQVSQIERIDKSVDDAHRVVLADPVVQAFGKQGGLAVRSTPSTKRLIGSPKQGWEIISSDAF
jgi:hypothetical protein